MAYFYWRKGSGSDDYEALRGFREPVELEKATLTGGYPAIRVVNLKI